ncbi:hypothetical protein Hanom_Chr00s007707g01738601 [Helianthus anomalus]
MVRVRVSRFELWFKSRVRSNFGQQISSGQRLGSTTVKQSTAVNGWFRVKPGQPESNQSTQSRLGQLSSVLVNARST